MRKKVTPRKTAMAVMMRMKCSISMAIGVATTSVDSASAAMRPMKVSSPVWMTTPVAVPSGTCVPKKARFFVSSGSSSVLTALRLIGSDSPVMAALSTAMSSVHSTMRMSAGMASPPVTMMMSPLTSRSASTSTISERPSLFTRLTFTCGGSMFANAAIMLSDLAFW